MLKDYYLPKKRVAGCDESGRGCLAGPVFAAAVILPRRFSHPLLDDSKKMNELNRLLVRDYIIEKAIAWSIGICDNHEIDKINILNASFLAMHKAIDNLSEKPDHLIIDGNRFNAYPGISHDCFIGGDGIYASIAAASVLAKTYRDAYMMQLHQQFPQYGWDTNKAYATPRHRKALVEFGRSPFHRESFHLNHQLEIEF